MWWFLPLAAANTWWPSDDGFVSETRTDAPTDARLLYAANFVPDVEVTAGPGAPFPLVAELLTGVGAPPRVTVLPPQGGWQPGAAYTVTVSSAAYANDTAGDTLSFTTSAASADPAPSFTVTDVTYGSWSDDQTYAWGCCEPVRTVTVEVDVPTADAWAYVEIVGDFAGPSQITTQEIHEHLDLEVGPGVHVLAFEQWLEDGEPQPACFDVVTVGASGDRGVPETFCTDEAGGEAPSGGTIGGCATSPAPRGLAALLVGLGLGYARTRRSPWRSIASAMSRSSSSA